MNYKIEQKDAFEVYGIERIFDLKDGENLKAIPSFWLEMLNNGEIEKLEASTGEVHTEQTSGLCGVNAICDYEDMEGTEFPYMLCAMKTDKSKTNGYKVVKVPSATWAIFRNEPHPIEETSMAVQTLNRRVYTDWLPTSNYKKIDGYELEVYYSDNNNMYYEETWIRVVPQN